MRVLDLSFHDPALNLALDEVLLDSAEQDRAHESLRFWECPKPFVVVGVSQSLHNEVDQVACMKDGIPVLRRCSAGGSVLQGPGSVNFNLVLAYDRDPALRNIRNSYCYILCRIREALAGHGIQVALEGISDLAVDGQKVSGNAQKRRKRFLLHHGTILYHADAVAMSRYLREPKDRPAYRGNRAHHAFIASLPLGPQELRTVVCQAFDVHFAVIEPLPAEMAQARELAIQKYRDHSWTYRR